MVKHSLGKGALRENGLKQDVNVAWPFGAAAEACPSRQGWIRKKLFEAPHRRGNFLVKNVPLPLSVRCLWRSDSQKLLRHARPLRAVGASCRAAGRTSVDLTKSILPARGAHPACG